MEDNNITDKITNLEEKIKVLENNINILQFENSRNVNILKTLQTNLLDNMIKNKIKSKLPNYNTFIKDLFEKDSVRLSSWKPYYKDILEYYNILFKNSSYVEDGLKGVNPTNVFWGSQFFVPDNITCLSDCLLNETKYVFAEMGFIHRVVFPSTNPKYSNGISFMFDDIAQYYDARFPNRLENMLNDKTLVITEEQKQRARICIDKIIETNLTKYNNQPIYNPRIGRDNVEKVLVIDQSYNDMSILKGFANGFTFRNMLDCAINENPNADIIVKTHPDSLTGCLGYYMGMQSHDNIYVQTEPINPLSIIKYVDKVYVCTSQFGFEAVMCNKDVQVFGMPFYAGWGITNDRQKCERRNNKRTLEEIFYIAYIMYTYYVNPDKNCRCEIEEAMNYLLKLRDVYFKEIKNAK